MDTFFGLILVGVLPWAVAQTDRSISTEYQTDRQIFTLETELSKLRRLHHQAKDRLGELEKDIVQYQSIFQGLRQLCSMLKIHEARYAAAASVEAPARSITPTVSGITAHSVRTSVMPIGQTAVVQVSVTFSTTETHQVIWAYNILGHMVPIKAGDPFSSWKTEKQNGQYTTHLYIGAGSMAIIELLYLKILSEFSEVTILFNKAVLLMDNSVNFLPVKLWNEEPSPEVLMLKPGNNASIITDIDTNVQDLSTFVNFIGIDTSVTPNKLLDIHIEDQRIQSNLKNTTKGFEWSVSLDNSLISLGGLVSLRTVERFKKGPVLQMHVGKTMYIIPDRPGTIKTPFPPNSLGLLALYKNTRQSVKATKPIGAIWCYAFGNPKPQTNIVKYSVDGQPHVLNGHVYSIGHYDAAEVVILRNVSRDDAGQYVCEARSGDNVAIEPITLDVS